MAMIIRKELFHKKGEFPSSTYYYLSSGSSTGWTVDKALATKFSAKTGNMIVSALNTSTMELEEGEMIDITSVVVGGDPAPVEAATVLGRLGGQATTEAKQMASRQNGKKGGRPKGSKNKSKGS